MKKTIILSLAAASALAACSKNQTGIVPETEALAGQTAPITFVCDSPVLRVETKTVTQTTAASLTSGGFACAGVEYDSLSYTTLFNCGWNYTTDCFVSASPYYYPASGSMNFYAVYPKSQAITVSGGSVSITYASDNQTDLVVASKSGVSATASSVSLSFDHILSLLDFKVKGSDENAYYKLNSISCTVKSGGTYSFSSGSWTTAGSSDAPVQILSAATPIGKGNASAVSDHSTYTSVGGNVTAVPCTPAISVSWSTYMDSGCTRKIADYSCSGVSIQSVSAGKKSTVFLVLPNNDAKTISFSVSVNEWGEETQEVSL